ncbi:hypothetical protein [Sphingomonas lacunae]|uniref:hypothetical protein n=1 Tax=Sphingomonas lacunae TaxID=2698828 RepID=UPI001FE9C460|nr:hypothetical protein [Sphingomonas lacunae]
MELKPGSRWKSAVCDGEMVVVRPPSVAGTLACGGHPVLAHGGEGGGQGIVEGHDGGLLMGKRYVDAESGIEVLGSKPGKGALSFDGRLLTIKDAKPLPASD